MKRPLLILDLDETLIWARRGDAPRPADFTVAQYTVSRRPHLSAFLDCAFAEFEVAVWTSSTAGYARPVVEEVFRGRPELRFMWARNRCVQRLNPATQEISFLKDLGKVKRMGFDLDCVLIVDDTPDKVRRHYGNLLRVTSFEGQPDDTELADVLPFLRWIRDQPNFRVIEKRAWRSRRFPAGT